MANVAWVESCWERSWFALPATTVSYFPASGFTILSSFLKGIHDYKVLELVFILYKQPKRYYSFLAFAEHSVLYQAYVVKLMNECILTHLLLKTALVCKIFKRQENKLRLLFTCSRSHWHIHSRAMTWTQVFWLLSTNPFAFLLLWDQWWAPG
jgi:hypothetical protein